MKSLIVLAVLFLSLAAHADVIKCTFTEPFIDSTYDMAQSTLTYTYPQGNTDVVKNVSFQIKSAGVFELVSKEGKVLQTLTLNNQGSDGMSEIVYPFEVKDDTPVLRANSGIGGCSSNLLKTSSL